MNDADLYRARDREVYWERVMRLVERGMTLRAAHIVIDAAMYSIGCIEGDDELANAARHARHVCTYPCEPCCEKDSEYSMELHATQPKKDWPTVKAEAKLAGLTTRRKR